MRDSCNFEAVQAKVAALRTDIVRMITAAGSGHPGGSLSAVEIMATLYFGGVLNYDAENPKAEARDRFILSKGHAAPVLYATLANAGYFPREELTTLRAFGSRLQGHPDSLKLPGVEVSTGSLGQGLSISSGLAYALAFPASAQSPTVFTLLGDGELQEGQVWEAAMFAAHYRLSNLVAIIDNNELQIDGAVSEVMDVRDISAKLSSFGWYVLEADGHDVRALYKELTTAKAHKEGPAVVVAHTVKGKGVSFMENQCGWHGKAPNAEQCAAALDELCAPGEAALSVSDRPADREVV
ncbi:MAG: transketolase [Coriobacteriales bacterium]|jgi:transketolase|nr:transketolase [Coriobacteriales bacterium]